MKLLLSDGDLLRVYDLGPLLMRVRRRPDGPPIKRNGAEVLEDDAARETLRGLIASGLYDREVVK